MTPSAGERQSLIIIIVAFVFISFLRIDRTDLLARHSRTFVATDHIAGEIMNGCPDQQRRFAAAHNSGTIIEVCVARPEEFLLLGRLTATERLGAGNCSAIALSAIRRFVLAMDDGVATRHARNSHPPPSHPFNARTGCNDNHERTP